MGDKESAKADPTLFLDGPVIGTAENRFDFDAADNIDDSEPDVGDKDNSKVDLTLFLDDPEVGTELKRFDLDAADCTDASELFHDCRNKVELVEEPLVTSSAVDLSIVTPSTVGFRKVGTPRFLLIISLDRKDGFTENAFICKYDDFIDKLVVSVLTDQEYTPDHP